MPHPDSTNSSETHRRGTIDEISRYATDTRRTVASDPRGVRCFNASLSRPVATALPLGAGAVDTQVLTCAFLAFYLRRLMRPKLNICKVWDADYPWDVRVEKVASTLTSRGCSVHLAARNTSRLPILEHRPEATVRRLRPWTWLPEAADTMAMFPVFANPRW